MTVKEFYDEIGGGYEGAVGRLHMDKILLKFCIKFLDDPSYNQLLEAAEKEDWVAAYPPAHTLKGIAKNMEFLKLIETASALSDYLKAHERGTSAETAVVLPLLEAMKADYAVINAGVEKLKAAQG